MAGNKRNFNLCFLQDLNFLMKAFQTFYIHIKRIFFIFTFGMHIVKYVVGPCYSFSQVLSSISSLNIPCVKDLSCLVSRISGTLVIHKVLK